MNRSLLSLTVFLVGLVLLFPASAAAQSTRLSGLDGGQLTDADLSSGNLILVVWTSWSPRCRDIVDRVNDLAGQWGDTARVVTVNFQEDGDQIREFLSGKKLGVPVYLDTDGSFSKSREITKLPGLVVVKDGAQAYNGGLPVNPDRLLSDIFG